jgi:Uma2 family endonuclease
MALMTYADLESLPDGNRRREPPGHLVLFAPCDWLVDDHNVYEPDLLVAPGRAFTDRFLPVPPVLAVEVLSPSHPGRDLVRKRAAYERAGLAHYWIVDPIAPSVAVLERVGGALVETAVAKGDEPVAVVRPFPVTLVAADLID